MTTPPAEAGGSARDRLLEHAHRMDALGRFAGGVAHDFNNLLTSIRGLGALVLEEIDPNHPVRPDLEEILKAAQRATELTGELLAFSGRQRTETSAVDVNALVAEVVGRIRSRDAAVVVEVDANPAVPFVAADPAKLALAIENLLVSGANASGDAAKVHIATSMMQLDEGQVAPLPAGEYAVIRVSDGGRLTGAQLEAVFEPFAAPRSATRGTGLALAVAYGIVRRAGGVIVASTQPDGTAMSAYLPLAPGVEGARPA